MKTTEIVRKFLGNGAKTSSAEIEDHINREDIKAVKVETMRGVPAVMVGEIFETHQELRDDILGKKNNSRKWQYHFQRDDDKTRETIMNAFNERDCKNLRRKEEQLQKKLERTQKELQNKNCGTQ